MGIFGAIAAGSAIAKAVKKAYQNSSKNKGSSSSSSSSGSSSAGSSNNSSGGSSGYYDKSKDYAALIQRETDESKRQQYISERQNKVNAMQSNGTWNNAWKDNSQYSGGTQSSFNNTTANNTAVQSATKAYQNAGSYAKGIINNIKNSSGQGGNASDVVRKAFEANNDQHSNDLNEKYGYEIPKANGGGTFVQQAGKTLSKLYGGLIPSSNDDEQEGSGEGASTDSQWAMDNISRMKKNSNMWGSASESERKRLAAENEYLASDLGSHYGLSLEKRPDGNWYYGGQLGQNAGKKLYDTVYQKAEPPQTAQEQYDIGFEEVGKQEIYDEYEDMAQMQEQARMAQVQQMMNDLNYQKGDVNQNFDGIAKQAYIARRMAETTLPQQLAASGQSGGMAESTSLGLQTNYENNLNENEVARQRQLADIQKSMTNAKLGADSDIAGYQAQANQAAFQAYLSQVGQKNSHNQWLAGFQADRDDNQYNRDLQDKTFAYQAAQDAYNKSQDTSSRLQSEKANEINFALQTGDYSVLKKYGYNTDYLTSQQKYTLAMQELEKEQNMASLQGTYLTNEKKKSSGVKKASSSRSTRGKSSGSKSSGGASGSSGFAVNDSGKSAGSTFKNANGNGWVLVRGYGRLGMTELEKLVNSGKIKETYENGKYSYR